MEFYQSVHQIFTNTKLFKNGGWGDLASWFLRAQYLEPSLFQLDLKATLNPEAPETKPKPYQGTAL